jgi:hypothetical protein
VIWILVTALSSYHSFKSNRNASEPNRLQHRIWRCQDGFLLPLPLPFVFLSSEVSLVILIPKKLPNVFAEQSQTDRSRCAADWKFSSFHLTHDVSPQVDRNYSHPAQTTHRKYFIK